MKNTKRQKALIQKRQQKISRMSTSGYKSKYARKARYLHQTGVWGWEVPSPKPWGSN